MQTKKRLPQSKKLHYGEGQAMVEAHFKNNPGQAMRNTEVRAALGLYPGTVSTATRELWLRGRLRRIQTGMYVYDIPEGRPNANDVAPKRAPSMNHVEPVATATIFEALADVGDGRIILRDEHKALWIASKL
jgi:hypothetical protein